MESKVTENYSQPNYLNAFLKDSVGIFTIPLVYWVVLIEIKKSNADKGRVHF